MSNRPTIAYQPALDGVRAFAVIAVLLFHAGVPGFDGGYLGVSVFFTLSGFLITSLLLREHQDTGGIDLAGFYARRLRRLLPASVLCLVGVALLGSLTDLFDGVVNLRAHVLGAVFQVANWVFLAGDGSYQDLLARTSGTSSPLEHFWSLAIEEQFYWVWPPLMMVVLGRVPRHRGRVVGVGAIALAAFVAAPVIAQVWGPDAAYWSTPARMSEILIGALLAVVTAQRAAPAWSGSLAPFTATMLGFCIVLFPSSSGPAYAGALPLVGLLSAGLVLGLQVPTRFRGVFELDAVVWVGTISYGLYLFHWPVFVLVHPDRFDWPGPLVFVARIVITLGLTVASYELIEQPIRSQRRRRPSITFTAAGASTVAVILIALLTVPTGIGEYWNPDAETVEAAAIEVIDTPLTGLVATGTTVTQPSVPAVGPSTPSSSPTAPVTVSSVDPEAIPSTEVAPSISPPSTDAGVAPVPIANPAPLPPLSRPVRIVVTGDSTAEAYGTGLVTWAADHPELAQVEVVSAPGCGFLVGGERRSGDTIAPIVGCDGWTQTFVYPDVERLEPDVVVAMVTSWDLVDRRWDTEELLTPLDDDFAARLSSDYGRFATDLLAIGAGQVVFLRQPIPDVFWLPVSDAQEDPARHAVIYDLYDRLADGDDRISVVPLDVWFTEHDFDRDENARPDGIHPTPDFAAAISEEYLGEQLVRIAIGVPES